MIEKLVSIIIPAFNSEKTIETAINSVLSQTYSNYEIIIIDDSSTDRTLQTIKDLYDNDKKIKILCNEKNLGSGETRNYGIREANGEFIAFLDADDEWYPHKLEEQILIFENHDVALVCSGYDIAHRDGRVYRRKQPLEILSYHELLKTNDIGCLTAIYSAKKIGKQYMLGLRKRQDYALWLTITRLHGPAFCVQEVLAKYKKMDNSISSNKLTLMKWNYIMFRQVTGYNKFICLMLVLRNTIIKIIYG